MRHVLKQLLNNLIHVVLGSFTACKFIEAMGVTLLKMSLLICQSEHTDSIKEIHTPNRLLGMSAKASIL